MVLNQNNVNYKVLDLIKFYNSPIKIFFIQLHMK